MKESEENVVTVSWWQRLVFGSSLSTAKTRSSINLSSATMSELPRGLLLKPPEKLPSTGVSKIAFKVFCNQLVAYLQQDLNNYMFLEGGVYSKWAPLQQSEKRIKDLVIGDTDFDKLEAEKVAKRKEGEVYKKERKELLLLRNSQCARFVQLIAVLCYYSEQDDIDQCSTSLDWIVKYLQQHYGLESRGSHFMDIAAFVFKKGTPHQTFYKQFRAGVMDNLRKKGEKLEYKNNEELSLDERMSPTLESMIVLWTLERIDVRLPVKVQKLYGHQMTGDTCLVTLQPKIFQNISSMLQELDESEPRSSAHGLAVADDGELGASNSGYYLGNSGRGSNPRGGGRFTTRPDRPRGGGRGSGGGAPPGRGSFGRGGSSGQAREWSEKFCRICYHQGAPQEVFESHTMAKCRRMTPADHRGYLRSVLGAGEVVSQNQEYAPREGDYEAPGWDVD